MCAIYRTSTIERGMKNIVNMIGRNLGWNQNLFHNAFLRILELAPLNTLMSITVTLCW